MTRLNINFSTQQARVVCLEERGLFRTMYRGVQTIARRRVVIVGAKLAYYSLATMSYGIVSRALMTFAVPRRRTCLCIRSAC